MVCLQFKNGLSFAIFGKKYGLYDENCTKILQHGNLHILPIFFIFCNSYAFSGFQMLNETYKTETRNSRNILVDIYIGLSFDYLSTLYLLSK